jgi:hypothetical protein
VVLKAREEIRGACHPKKSKDTYSLHVLMTDDNDEVILDETRSDLACNKRVGKQMFWADYGVTNCENSEAPEKRSKGEITITATTDDGELTVSRTLKCKK